MSFRQKPRAGASTSCWECQRRETPCDGSRPICANCNESGLVCPGFGNQQPLTWVTPGKVTHRAPQRPSRRRAKAGVKTNSKQKGGIKSKPDDTDERFDKKALPQPRTQSNTETAVVPICQSSVSTCDLSDSSLASASCLESDTTWSEVSSPSSTTCASYPQDMTISRQRTPSSAGSWSPLNSPFPLQLQVAQVPRSLWVDEYDVFDAVHYYAERLYMPAYNRQLVPRIYFPKKSIEQMLSRYISRVRRHALIAMTIAHYMIDVSKDQDDDHENSYTSVVPNLWPKFYHHIGVAIRLLNDELSNPRGTLSNDIFSDILLLIGAESMPCVSNRTLAHVYGFIAMLKQQGGLRKIVQFPDEHTTGICGYVISCVLADTTSPSHNPVTKGADIEDDDVYSFYLTGAMPGFLCPPHLFRNILQINKLRVKAANDPYIMAQGETGWTDARTILQDIQAFIPAQWIKSTGYPHPEECLLLARIFKCTVALYAIISLDCDTGVDEIMPQGDDVPPGRHQLRELLFDLLEPAIDSKCIENMLWPLMVAGVASKTAAERTTVNMALGKFAAYSDFVGSTRALKPILKRFWQSGKTGWDDCFDRPTALA